MRYAIEVMFRLLLVIAVLAGCDRAERRAHARGHTTPRTEERGARAEERAARAEERAAPAAPAAPPVEEGPADELVSIAAGSVLAGSKPGQGGRRPAWEMDENPLPLTEFSIERDVRSARGLSHEQAAGVCASDGRRLCTELEWEWACEGTGHRDHAQARTALGVRSMGLAREWTASVWGDRADEKALGWTLRGARPDAPESARRCAAREPSIPPPPEEDRPAVAPQDASVADVAFRCCEGDANEARYVMEPPRGTFLPVKLPAERFASVVRSIPELREVHENPVTFSAHDVEAALTHAGPGAPQAGWRFGADPLIWTPERGEQILVLLGKSGHHSFIAALYRLQGDRFAHAASMILRDDTTPLLLAWGALRRELIWTPCWNCQETEGGKIVYRIETSDLRVTHY